MNLDTETLLDIDNYEKISLMSVVDSLIVFSDYSKGTN